MLQARAVYPDIAEQYRCRNGMNYSPVPYQNLVRGCHQEGGEDIREEIAHWRPHCPVGGAGIAGGNTVALNHEAGEDNNPRPDIKQRIVGLGIQPCRLYNVASDYRQQPADDGYGTADFRNEGRKEVDTLRWVGKPGDV